MRTYQELSLEERIEIQQRVDAGDSLRAIARTLGRSPSTISRECRRVTGAYRAQASQRHARVRRRKPRVRRKLGDQALWDLVQEMLRTGWSPQQIAGILAKMSSASAADALTSFSEALERIPEPLRKTLTYDQGREMTYHAALTLRTGVQVYFADPRSPWQWGSNENTNGLLRQYMPKGTDLSVYSQDELNRIAFSLNTRPRQRHGFRTPLEVYNELLALTEASTGTMH